MDRQMDGVWVNEWVPELLLCHDEKVQGATVHNSHHYGKQTGQYVIAQGDGL